MDNRSASKSVLAGSVDGDVVSANNLNPSSSGGKTASISFMSSSADRMLELMSWNEIIENLRVEGNFKMAVLFDLKADKIAGTDGAMMEKQDAMGIMRSMDLLSTRIYGIFLAGSEFRCLAVDKDSVVGRAGNDVFVASRNDNILICVVSSVQNDFSCLGAVKSFMGRLGVDGTRHKATPSLI